MEQQGTCIQTGSKWVVRPNVPRTLATMWSTKVEIPKSRKPSPQLAMGRCSNNNNNNNNNNRQNGKNAASSAERNGRIITDDEIEEIVEACDMGAAIASDAVFTKSA